MNTYGKRYPGSGSVCESAGWTKREDELNTDGPRVVHVGGGGERRRLAYASLRLDS